ncbi:MAG: hypothetical protein ABSD30_16540 [Candidatus Binatus sp.]
MSQNRSTTTSIAGAATIGPHLSPSHASRMIVARQSAKMLHASLSPMMTISDSSGRRIRRSSACCTARLIWSRVASSRAIENSAVSDAASVALSTTRIKTTIGRTDIIAFNQPRDRS